MKIKEVSKIFGIPEVTIRYIEQQGFLFPRREENNYREYSLSDLSALLEYQKYRNMGMSPEAIREFISSGSVQQFYGELGKCAEKAGRQMEEAALLRDYLTAYRKRAGMLDCNQGLYWFEKRPASLYLVVGYGRDGECELSRNILDAQWRQRVPYVSLMYLVEEAQLEKVGWESVWGLCCEEYLAERMGLPMDSQVQRMPEKLCLSTCVVSRGDDQDVREACRKGLDILRNRGYVMDGPALMEFVSMRCQKDGITNYCQVYLPAKKTL